MAKRQPNKLNGFKIYMFALFFPYGTNEESLLVGNVGIILCKILFLLWMVEGCIIMVEISCFQSAGCALLCIFFDCSHIICFYEV